MSLLRFFFFFDDDGAPISWGRPPAPEILVISDSLGALASWALALFNSAMAFSA